MFLFILGLIFIVFLSLLVYWEILKGVVGYFRDMNRADDDREKMRKDIEKYEARKARVDKRYPPE